MTLTALELMRRVARRVQTMERSRMRCDRRRWVAVLLIIGAGLLSALGAASAARQILYVQPAYANLRQSPAIEPGNRLALLPGGAPLNAFELEGDWYPVQLQDGRTGWMHRSVLGPTPPATPAPEARLPLARIGVVQDGAGLEAMFLPIFQREIRDLLREEYDVRFPEAMQLQGDWTALSVQAALDRLLAHPRVDMILALGPLASQAAAQRRDLAKPVFAPFIINASLQNIPLRDGSSGVRNLSYVMFPNDMERDLQAFMQVARFKKVAFLVAAGIAEALPQLLQSVEATVAGLGLEAAIAPVGQSADEALAALPEDSDAVYVAPQPHMPPAEFQRLVNGLTARRLPSFAFRGRVDVERGLLFGLARSANTSRLARRVALNMQRTLLGEDPGTFPVAFSRGERMTLNMATARAIGLTPPWEFLTQMEVLHGEPEALSRRLSLPMVVEEAARANLDLQAIERFVAAGKQDVREARAALWPQLTARLQGRVIDDDRANVGLPERAGSAALELSQLIYAEPTWANLRIQQRLQLGREAEKTVTLLDVALEATTRYLQVLSAKTVERIQRDNLNLTRTNLELARVRRSIGVARPNEVLRWESQMANNRRQVINAFTQREQAAIGLNRVLHRPLEERFATTEPDLDDPRLMTSFARILPYVDNPRYFEILRDFMVQQGLEAAPELRQAAAQIAAQERALQSADRSFYTPRIVLSGNLSRVDTDGVGSSGAPGDEINWEVGVQASLPLYTGGARLAQRRRSRETLAQLRLQRDATAERIAANIRIALYAAGSAYANIRPAREAAAASGKNLELVADAYGRGAVAILDLLDAQRDALSASLDEANTVYDYLMQLMQMQRAIGQFDFFVSEGGRQNWLERLDAYFQDQGVAIDKRRQ